MSRRRTSREQRALNAARQRRDNGDPRPFMVVLKEERDRRGIVPPLDKSTRSVETIRSGLL